MAKEQACACCPDAWKAEVQTERGPMRLCAGCAAFALEQRSGKTPKQKASWEKLLKRVFNN